MDLFETKVASHSRRLTSASVNSASPLNGEAARLWETDREEYARKVLERHQEPEEMEQATA